MTREAVIVGVRTAVGRAKKARPATPFDELAAALIRELRRAEALDPAETM